MKPKKFAAALLLASTLAAPSAHAWLVVSSDIVDFDLTSDGDVLALDRITRQVLRYDPTTGALQNVGALTPPPMGMTEDVRSISVVPSPGVDYVVTFGQLSDAGGLTYPSTNAYLTNDYPTTWDPADLFLWAPPYHCTQPTIVEQSLDAAPIRAHTGGGDEEILHIWTNHGTGINGFASHRAGYPEDELWGYKQCSSLPTSTAWTVAGLSEDASNRKILIAGVNSSGHNFIARTQPDENGFDTTFNGTGSMSMPSTLNYTKKLFKAIRLNTNSIAAVFQNFTTGEWLLRRVSSTGSLLGEGLTLYGLGIKKGTGNLIDAFPQPDGGLMIVYIHPSNHQVVVKRFDSGFFEKLVIQDGINLQYPTDPKTKVMVKPADDGRLLLLVQDGNKLSLHDAVPYNP